MHGVARLVINIWLIGFLSQDSKDSVGIFLKNYFNIFRLVSPSILGLFIHVRSDGKWPARLPSCTGFLGLPSGALFCSLPPTCALTGPKFVLSSGFIALLHSSLDSLWLAFFLISYHGSMIITKTCTLLFFKYILALQALIANLCYWQWPSPCSLSFY